MTLFAAAVIAFTVIAAPYQDEAYTNDELELVVQCGVDGIEEVGRITPDSTKEVSFGFNEEAKPGNTIECVAHIEVVDCRWDIAEYCRSEEYVTTKKLC